MHRSLIAATALAAALVVTASRDARAWDPSALVAPVWGPGSRAPVPFHLQSLLERGFDEQLDDPTAARQLDLYLGTAERTGSAQLLVDGGESFPAREAVARSAQRTLFVQQLYWPVGVRTARLMALMAARVEEGVIVRLLVDRLATGPPDRPWLEEFDAYLRGRYAALAHRYPRFARELEETRSTVVLYTTPESEVPSDVIQHDEAGRQLEVRRLTVPPIGRPNLLCLNHSKMVLADGERAVTGGINQSDVYAARGRQAGDPPPLSDQELELLAAAIPTTWPVLVRRYGPRLDHPDVPVVIGWRDTDLRVGGPIARDLEASFLRFWAFSRLAEPTDTGEWWAGLSTPAAPPRVEEVKHYDRRGPVSYAEPRKPRPRFDAVRMRKVEHIPRAGESYMARQTRWLFGSARRYIYCHIPYLLMPEVQAQWIARAARRGVRVRLLTNGPDSNDIHRAVSWAVRSRYRRLLRQAGPNLHLYEWVQAPLHSKVCVADGRVTIVSSNNHDYVSQFFAAELGITVTSRSFARDARRMMIADLRASRPIRMREAIAWERRVGRAADYGSFDWGPVQMARTLEGAITLYLGGHVRLRMDLFSL